MKKILVTGNLGYIGSVLTPKLVKKGYYVVGLDCGFFKDCITDKKKKLTNKSLKILEMSQKEI